MKIPNEDSYGTIVNGENIDTFEWAAEMLSTFGSVIFAWTDQEGTQLDILLTYKTGFSPSNISLLQDGVRHNDLFVSIMRMGSFGFEISHDDTFPSYYAEKLGLGGEATAEKLAVLLNGIKRELVKI